MRHEAPDNSPCKAARDLCHDWLDGLADGSALADHLAVCADCRRYVSQMRDIQNGLARLRVETEVVERPAYRRLMAIAAAILIAVGAGLSVFVSRAGKEDSPVKPIVQAPVVDHETAGPEEEPEVRQASVALTGRSAKSFVTMPRETGHPHVHLFVIYPLSQAAVAREGS